MAELVAVRLTGKNGGYFRTELPEPLAAGQIWEGELPLDVVQGIAADHGHCVTVERLKAAPRAKAAKAVELPSAPE